MKINSDIFRAYDIRGVYPTEVNEETVYSIGRAFIKFLKETSKKEKLTVAVGRDCRSSSPSLFESLTKGIRDQGAEVIDIGMSTTPMLYFSVISLDLDGGVEITASHNSGEQNGLKLVREEARPISGTSGIEDIKEYVLANDFETKDRGRLIKQNIEDSYVENVWRLIDPKNIKKFKIVVDAGNGMGSLAILRLLKKLKCEILLLPYY